MSKLFSASIDVSKITKNKLIQGKKGQYLNITFSVNDEPNKFGQHVSIWEGQTEEERNAKKDRNFLGNGKVIWSDEKIAEPITAEEDYDDLPF